MTVRLRWLGVAVEEAREARLFYEEQSAGLGDDFLHEVGRTTSRIVEHPLAWPEVDQGIRKTLVSRFPYLIHYAVQTDEILVLGVYHAKRKPISWRERLEETRGA